MRRLPQRGLLVALLAVAATAACARCGAAAGPPPERYVPADAVLAVVVPEIRGSARSLGRFYATAEDFPGSGQISSLRASASAQLGFDPLDLDALRGAGIDPRGGAALAWLPPPAGAIGPRPPVLLVLPVYDRVAADARVRRIAADRLGAAARAVEPVGAAQVAVYRQQPGGAPALAVAEGPGTLILAAGPAGPAAVARAVTLPPAASLLQSAAWGEARRAAGREPAAVAFAPPRSPVLEGLDALRGGAAIALSAEPRRLRARVVVLLGGARAAVAGATAGGRGGDLAARLDPGAAVVGRYDGDPAALAGTLEPLLSADERARLRAAGVDLPRDLLAALGPGAAAAVSLAPRIDLPSLDAVSLRRDPLRLVQFEVVAPVRDAARLRAASERLTRLAKQRPRADGFAIPTPSGELAWTVDGERLLLAGGAPGRLAALRARLAQPSGGYRAPTDAARRALETGGIAGAVVDTHNLVASVRALPAAAFGAGPTGFVMRSLADRIVDPAARIDAASVRVDVEGGALVIAVDVEPRAAEEGAP